MTRKEFDHLWLNFYYGKSVLPTDILYQEYTLHSMILSTGLMAPFGYKTGQSLDGTMVECEKRNFFKWR